MTEANILTEYLLGKGVSQKEEALYNDAMLQLNIELTEEEQSVWEYMFRNKWTIPCIDGALALTEPNGNIRRKIFILLAILEASPEHAERFLPRRFNLFYIFKIIFTGIVAVLRAITGLLILKLIR